MDSQSPHAVFLSTVDEMIAAIAGCREKRQIRPTLILLYAFIDTLGWLDSSDDDASATSFEDWVDRYLLARTPMECTSSDLYGARCGVLHTLRPESRRSRNRQARQIFYSWGLAKVEELRSMIQLHPTPDAFVAVNVDELLDGLQRGIVAFVDELSSDAARQEQVFAKCMQWFACQDAGLPNRMCDAFAKAKNDAARR